MKIKINPLVYIGMLILAMGWYYVATAGAEEKPLIVNEENQEVGNTEEMFGVAMQLCIIFDVINVERSKSEFLAIHPNTETQDTADCPQELKDIGSCPQELIYTNSQWIKEKIRRMVKLQLERGAKILERQNDPSFDRDTEVQ